MVGRMALNHEIEVRFLVPEQFGVMNKNFKKIITHVIVWVMIIGMVGSSLLYLFI